MEKLRQLAKELFAEAPKYEPDHFAPAGAEAGGRRAEESGGSEGAGSTPGG